MSKYQYTVKGVDYDVEIEEIEGDVAKVSVNGIPFEVVLKQPVRTMPKPAVKPQVQKPVAAAAAVAAPKQEAPAAPKPAAGAGNKITAPLPGTITNVLVKVGDTVKQGDTVLILEAMKMQNNIESDTAGTVTSVLVNRGDTVMEGATLVTIA